MKQLLAFALALSPLTTLAATPSDIELSYHSVSGFSSGKSAVEMIQALRAAGVKPQVVRDSERYEIANGQITMTNGAACDNGRRTYQITFDVVDTEQRVLQKVDLNDSDVCKLSRAEKLAKLLDKWGAEKLAGDCGLGHCWTRIDSISCSRSLAKPGQDLCSVSTSDGPLEQN